jgi:hypothetical protein
VKILKRMFRKFSITLILALSFSSFVYSQCSVGQKEVIIEIFPDDYPDEISWNLKENGIQIAAGNFLSDTVCIGENSCLQFTILDSYGDGICCGQGNGFYNLYINGTNVQTGGNYTSSETYTESCAPGSICETAIPITEGIYAAPVYNTFYSFTPDTTGNYYLTTCNQSSCDTKLWIYENCGPEVLNTDGNGAFLYDDDGANCGYAAGITAYLTAGTTYYLKIGLYDNQSCPGEIGFELTFLGEIIGCMDPNACNYNPLATISDGICYGNETIDCNGVCNGGAIFGDMNGNQMVELTDVDAFITGILDQNIVGSDCKDLSNDSFISVWDAALSANCALNSANCTFPNENTNLNETVEIGFTTINSLEQTIDIYIKNPQTSISGYELNVSGIVISNVESLIDQTQFPNNPRFNLNGTKIIALSINDSLIDPNNQNTPFLRVYFDSITSHSICVESVIHCLNQSFRPTKVNLIDACVQFAELKENQIANFSIFPNPANEMVEISFQNSSTEKLPITVFDALGRIVFQDQITDFSKPFQINTSLYENGFYQISIQQGNLSTTKKMLVVHN